MTTAMLLHTLYGHEIYGRRELFRDTLKRNGISYECTPKAFGRVEYSISLDGKTYEYVFYK